MSRLRAGADAVLVGGATFRNWPHPSLPDAADRVALREQPTWNVVVTRTLDVPLTPEFLDEPRDPPAVPDPRRRRCATASRPRSRAGAARGESADRLDRSSSSPARGVERLLVEAGGDLLFQFLAADALDEMHVTLCPLVVGGDAPSLVDGAGFDLADLRRLHLLASEVEGDEVFLHYRNLRGGHAA